MAGSNPSKRTIVANKLKGKATLTTMVSGLLLQFVTIISGFIIPRIILLYFGSAVNGLVSSINQFLSYIYLIEGGITGVVSANLYKALASGDIKKISSVVVTAKKFFNKIGLIFISYAVVLAFVYPVLFNTKYDYTFVCTLALILSVNLAIQYMFALSLRTFLIADKKGYIVNFTQIVITLLNIILAYVSVIIYPSIHLLKLLTGISFAVQPIVFSRYINKNYKIDWKSETDNNLIKERWNGFAINIAAFIHNSTDVTLLTVFSSLEIVSIYNVYSIVTTGVKSLIKSVTSSINPTIGIAYARRDYNDLHQKLDLYEYIVFLLVFFMFTMTGLLITPFVMIYTHGVTDVDYNQPLFGVLFVLAEGLYLIKYPHLNLAYSANKFKEIRIPAFIEAGLNILVSLALINKLGLVGVAIGTVVAMIYRMAFHVYFTSKFVPNRPQRIFYKKFLAFSITATIGAFACTMLFPIHEYTVLQWVLHALEYAAILGTLFFSLSIVLFKKELRYFVRYLKHNS